MGSVSEQMEGENQGAANQPELSWKNGL